MKTCECPRCGAPMLVKLDQQTVTCKYCGSSMIVRDFLDDREEKADYDARMKELEEKLRQMELEREIKQREEQSRRESQEKRRRELERAEHTGTETLQRLLADKYLFGIAIGALLLWAAMGFKNGMGILVLALLVYGGVKLGRSAPVKSNQRGQYQNLSPRSWLVTLLLEIFLGYLGVHYFYVGRFGMGILYLFTFGLFGIGWMVDFFRIVLGAFTDGEGRYLRP